LIVSLANSGGVLQRCRRGRRPGGNLTGVTTLNLEVVPKRMELLHALIPTTTLVALLVDPTSPTLAETTT
jgi:putative ABC transport system substrate-binding protein